MCDEQGQSPLYIASQKGGCDVLKCLHSSGADINLHDEDGLLPLFVASYSGHYDIVILLTAHKAISKRTKYNEFLVNIRKLLIPCGYPEEEISHSKEK